MSFRSNSNIGAQISTNQRLFGAGFTQSIAIIQFGKTDLTGLKPAPNNTAESLFVGIIMRLLQGLNSRGNADINYWGSALNGNKRTDVFVINFYVAVTYTDTYEIDDLPNPYNPNIY
ncbi:MAG: hypothetical protein KME23_07995 [Goleter apudmare HA4340-LM2]|jgi:hypothetical protein|nr:hypothetical protein [Goleter apudmare HA4340-LM2]